MQGSARSILRALALNSPPPVLFDGSLLSFSGSQEGKPVSGRTDFPFHDVSPGAHSRGHRAPPAAGWAVACFAPKPICAR